MDFIILNDRSTKLSVCLEEKEVVINYFSIFDTDTFESESMTLSFDKDSFVKEVEKLLSDGQMSIANGKTSIAFDKKDGYNVTLSRDGNTARLMGVDFDVDSFAEFIKK